MRMKLWPRGPICAALLLVMDLSGAPAALAQQPAAEATQTTAAAETETIIVSARKRAESIADVPTSITAFTAESLKDYNIQSFDDYATKTPNMSFTYGTGPTGIADARTVAIRGITGQNFFGTAGATGFYIDDTPVPGSINSTTGVESRPSVSVRTTPIKNRLKLISSPPATPERNSRPGGRSIASFPSTIS